MKYKNSFEKGSIKILDPLSAYGCVWCRAYFSFCQYMRLGLHCVCRAGLDVRLVHAMQSWSMVWLLILFVEGQLACLVAVLWIRSQI